MTDKITPVWAESGSTGTAPTDEKIQSGFVKDDKPAFQRMNWLLNRIENNINRMTAWPFWNNWYLKDATTVSAIYAIEYHPVLNGWYLVDGTNLRFLSRDNAWTSIAAHAGAPSRIHCSCITPSYAIFGTSGATELLGTDGTGITITDATMTMAAVYSMCSKYVDGGSDEFLMIGGTAGQVEYTTGGIGAAWTAAVPVGSAATVNDLVWLGGTSFAAAMSDGHVFTTANTGAAWTDRGAVGSVTQADAIDYNATTGRLTLVGETAADIYIYYSDDSGANWTAGTIANKTVEATATLREIKYIGGNCWVAGGNPWCGRIHTSGDATNVQIIISFDDGENWAAVDVKDDFVGETNCIGFDGSRIMSGQADANGSTFASLSAIPQ